MKNNKGITMTSLIVTIIVMVILAGIALLFSVGDSGVILRAEKTQFLEDMKLYKEELELYKGKKQILNQKRISNGENIELDDGIDDDFDEWDHEDIVGNKYIPSMKSEYYRKIIIWNGELAYIKANLTAKEEELALAAGLIPFDEKVNIIVEIEGQGAVKVDGGELPENGIINVDIGTTINLNAEPGKKQIGDKIIEYVFDGWYEDGKLLASDANYNNYEVMGEAEITAKFTSNVTIIYFDNGSVELNTNDIISGYSNRADIVKVEIRDGVTIAARAFEGCTNLETVTIGDDVIIKPGGGDYTEKNKGTFANCSKLQTVTMGNNIKMPNTTYYYYWFNNCPELEEVTVESISEVGYGAFAAVGPALKGTIIINEGENTIDTSAFNGCINITSVSLPTTLTKINTNAFINCSGIIEKINLPENLINIGQSAFYKCSGIQGELIIKSNMTLGLYAFNNCYNMTSLKIEDGIEIPARSFENCTGLETIVIGNNVTIRSGGGDYTEKNKGTFANCINLKKVIMGKNIKMPNTTYYSYWFNNCTALEEVTVESLSEVGYGAFSKVGPALKGKIIINEGEDTIDTSAFNGCMNITSVSLPTTLTKINTNAFINCSGIIEKINLPENLINIGQSAFYKCSGIQGELIIKSNMTLGLYAFNNCYNMTSLKIEDGIEIPARSFENCTGLETIVIGNNVTIRPGGGDYTEKNKGTFANCSKLQTVTMGNNIKMPNTTYYCYWFNNCPALENVTVGTLLEVGYGAFSKVGPALNGSITIKEDTAIDTNAFTNCSNITSVNLPSSITSIGANAFSGCSGLETINIDMTEEEFNAITKGSNWNKGVTATIDFMK